VDDHLERRDAERARDEAVARALAARTRVGEISQHLSRMTSGVPHTPMLAADRTRFSDGASTHSQEAHARSRRCHQRAARAHDRAAAQHDRAAAVYDAVGDAATAGRERAAGIRERRAAEREREAAQPRPRT
jgi:hypothetical protein